MKHAAIIVASALAAAAGALLVMWLGPLKGPGSVHMWIAMALGAAGTAALWVGLMMLSFHSNERGYDDAAAGDD